MKTLLILCMFIFSFTIDVKGQVPETLVNVNRNYNTTDYHPKYDQKRDKKKGRATRIVLASGILIGGLIIANEAHNHDYYVRNTTIYGVGGVMTILATGLVLSSVNLLNKEIHIASTNKGLTIRIRI